MRESRRSRSTAKASSSRTRFNRCGYLLHDVLAEVKSFREADVPVVEVDDPIARGKAALDRSIRRTDPYG